MANDHLSKAKETQRSKMQCMVGHTKNYRHGSDKAPRLAGTKPAYGPFRAGDVMHSLADIGKAQRLLGYEPTHSIERGLDESLAWYERNLK